ncbi:alpha/beta fold hydrolase [Jannaschia sp. W003]|uniref:alpha/beta fold hydrolase n=1 Tax=Jannaschia sp. W003 TaxID=2867012 RepID=UPI0021A5A082|nr:alpha/beta hydrolase [Jannaschia sp. W003]UWQ20640.1 alpha/beta hydrolase [Jannaschia sp. W003]
MSADAPFHEPARGPRVRALWTDAADGVRLRAALWPEGHRGTVVLFPGRTEYVEKYAEVARDLHGQGFASAAIDWRGQGLTERLPQNRLAGHVGDFAEYQRDADAFVALLRAEGMPEPFHLLAHSMGGMIGLRALLRRMPFERAAFSAPMWGLGVPPHMRALAWAMSHAGHFLGYGEALAPASGKSGDPAGAPFHGNLLTTDPGRFAWMKGQLRARPELALGPPSLSWLRAALREMLTVRGMASPPVPALALLGTDERIVDPAAVRRRIARWPDGALHEVEGGRHEVLMERDALRGPAMARIVAHLGAT